MHKRLTFAILLGTGVACLAFIYRLPTQHAGDFTWVWRGTQLLLEGHNPYTTAGYGLDWPLYYPLPALLLTIPLASLSSLIAGTLFIGISVALLGYGLFSEAHAFRWPLLLSAPFVTAVMLMQWTPLLTAVYLIPALAPLILCKPTLGLPFLAVRRPSLATIVISMVVLAISLVVLPSWPQDWLGNLGAHQNGIPLLTIPGICLLYSVTMWRRAEARLLLGFALMPQRGYDPLALWLIPQTNRACMILSICSWVGYLGWYLTRTVEWIVVWMYLPALIMLIQAEPEQAINQTLQRYCSMFYQRCRQTIVSAKRQ